MVLGDDVDIKAYSAVGRGGRVLAARLLPGQDIVEGIMGLVKKEDLQSGTVTAIGSLRAAKVAWGGSMDLGHNPMDVAVFVENFDQKGNLYRSSFMWPAFVPDMGNFFYFFQAALDHQDLHSTMLIKRPCPSMTLKAVSMRDVVKRGK